MPFVQKPNVIEFERLARAYLSREVSWDTVHNYAVAMEVSGVTDSPATLKQPLESLHSAFLAADERDDPQFRADPQEIASLWLTLTKLGASSGLSDSLLLGFCF
jgi:hypothetical protein